MRPYPRGANPHQLTLDWTAAAAPPAPETQEHATGPLPAKGDAPPPPVKKGSIRRPRETKPSDRVLARFPVPRPLPSSVEAGTFGRNEDGSVIRPGADEIRALTETLVDRLIELLDAMQNVTESSARQRFEKQFNDAVAMYGMDFGDRAARQLEAYVRKQASLDEDRRADRGWSR